MKFNIQKLNIAHFNKAQQEAITNPSRNILVSAAAGSGKTTVMIERILRLLSEGEKLDSMIVCTFTKASAEDMRKKLLKRLTELQSEHWASEALAALPLANISTIDSFCSYLCRDYFYFTDDIDPSFEVIESGDVMLNASVKEVIDNRLLDNCSQTIALYDALGGSRYSQKLHDLIKNVYEFAFIRANPIEWLENLSLMMPTGYECKKLLMALTSNNIAEFETGVDPALTADFVKVIASLAVETSVTYADKKRRAFGMDFNDVVHTALKIIQTDGASEAINAKYNYLFVDEFQDINGLQEAVFASINANKFFVGDIKQSIYRFRGAEPSIFLRYRDEFNCDDSTDSTVISLNRNYRSSSDILNYCDSVFDPIMSRDFGGEDYEKDGAFRANELVATGGKDIIFDKPIVNKIISVQRPSQTKTTTNLPKVYSVENHFSSIASNCVSSNNDIQIDAIVHHILSLKQTKFLDANTKQKRFVENDDIAIMMRGNATSSRFGSSLVKALNANGIATSIIGDKSGFSNNEFAVALTNFLRLIVNSHDDVIMYGVLKSCMYGYIKDASLLRLKEFAKKIDNYKSSPIKQSPDSCDIKLNCSKSAQDTKNSSFLISNSLLGATASLPFYALARNYATCGDDITLKDTLTKLFADLKFYKNLSACISLAELAGRIVADFSMFDFTLGAKNDVAVEFAQWLDALKSIDVRLSLDDALKVLDKGGLKLEKQKEPDTVAIMTMHASKGLEFPFVCLVNLSKKFNKTDLSKEYILDSQWGLAIKYFDLDNKQRVETSFRTLAKALLNKRSLEEEMRLLYVALTRSIYQVALFGEIVEGTNTIQASSAVSFVDWIPLCERKKGECRIDNRYFDASNQYGNVINSCIEFSSAESKPTLPTLTSPFLPLKDFSLKNIDFTLPKSNVLLKTTATAIAAKTKQVDGGYFDAETQSDNIIKYNKEPYHLLDAQPTISLLHSPLSAQENSAFLYGNAFHAFMEFCDFNALISPQIDVFASKQPTHFALLNKEKLQKTATAIAKKISGRDYHKEQPFVYRDDSGTLVQGIIDLLIIGNDNSVEVIDYKTGKISTKLKTQYRAQLNVYRTAVNKILKAISIKTIVFSLTSGDFLEV